MYALDLEHFSLAKFKAVLERGDLLPSRRILLEDITERFVRLEGAGIRNLAELNAALGTAQKIARFAADTGIPVEYLEILKRQTRIYTPNPQPLKEIPGVDPAAIRILEAAGIRQTKQLFERAASRKGRADLAQETGLSARVLLEMACLADLTRAGWVGPIFARLIYESGAVSLEKLRNSDPAELYERVMAVNREQNLTKGNFTVKDVAACIEIAAELTLDLES